MSKIKKEFDKQDLPESALADMLENKPMKNCAAWFFKIIFV